MRFVVAGGGVGGVREFGEGGKKIQASSSKHILGCNIQHGDCN